MPSPFPGVDPFVEAESGWGDFHHRYSIYCSDAIGLHLPDDYVARFDEQVRLVPPSMDRTRAEHGRPEAARLASLGYPRPSLAE